MSLMANGVFIVGVFEEVLEDQEGLVFLTGALAGAGGILRWLFVHSYFLLWKKRIKKCQLFYFDMLNAVIEY